MYEICNIWIKHLSANIKPSTRRSQPWLGTLISVKISLLNKQSCWQSSHDTEAMYVNIFLVLHLEFSCCPFLIESIRLISDLSILFRQFWGKCISETRAVVWRERTRTRKQFILGSHSCSMEFMQKITKRFVSHYLQSGGSSLWVFTFLSTQSQRYSGPCEDHRWRWMYS